jgi:phosphatidyl-myo-inositol dimannoside synthase
MRLTLLCPDLVDAPHGGIPTVSRQSLRQLERIAGEQRMPLELDIWALHDKPTSTNEVARVVGLSREPRSFRAFSGSRLGMLAAAALEAQPSDVVFTTHLGLGPVARMLRKRARIVQFIHGVEVWRPLPPHQRAGLAATGEILSNSAFTLSRFLDYNPDFRALPSRVCWLGLPLDRATNDAAPPETNAAPRALIVGRIHHEERYKGHAELIAIWRRVRKVCPGAVLDIVGDGPARPSLEAMAERRGLLSDGSVHFWGRIPDAELRARYQEATIFAMPSRGEGFGLVYLEAMAAGKPCIGSLDDAAREVILHGETGLSVRYDRPLRALRRPRGARARRRRALHGSRWSRASRARRPRARARPFHRGAFRRTALRSPPRRLRHDARCGRAMSDAAAGSERLGAPGMAERVLKGIAAMSVAALVNYIGQLAIVPLGMHAWGPTKYGEWTSLSALVAFLAMTDLGVQSHVVNRMCAHHARGDHDELLAELHSALRLQGPLAIGLWAAAALVAAVLPLDVWFGIGTATRFETYLTLVLLGAELLLGVPLGAVRGTYRATGQLVRAALLTALKRAVEMALPAALMVAGAPFPVIALARVVWALLVDVYVVYDLHKQNPWFRLLPLGGDRKTGLRMLAPGALFLAAGLGDFLVTQGNLLVVQSVIGGEEVSRFATHRNIANMGRMLSLQISAVVWPELTALDALSDGSRLVRAYRTTSKFTGFVVGFALIGFLPLAELVYSAWTLRKLSLDMPTLLLLAAQATLWGFWGSSSTALLATNRQGRVALLLATNAAVSFVLSILLVPRLGIRGVAAASLAADLAFASWVVPRAACHALGDRFSGYAREILGVLGLAVLVPAAFAALLYALLPAGMLRAFVVPPVFGAAALVAFWFTLAPEERATARRVSLKIRGKLFASRGAAA